MELLLGRNFRLFVLEQAIRSMRVGEVAHFSRIPLPLTATDYPLFSKQYRAYARSKSSARDNDHHDHHHEHRCCGGAGVVTTGHPDLDRLVQHPEPLELTIELLSVQSDYEREVWQMESDQEKWQAIGVLRQEAKILIEKESPDFASAAHKYGKALTLVQQLQLNEGRGSGGSGAGHDHDDNKDNWHKLEHELRPLLLSNYAQCHFALGDFYAAIRHSTDVLAIDPAHVKSLFRRGRARAAVWDFDGATSDLQQAALLNPSLTPAVAHQLQAIHVSRRRTETEERRRLQGRMFPSSS